MTSLSADPARRAAWPQAAASVLVMIIVYTAGFRAAGFAWEDAWGASSAHVLPGAIVIAVAWRLQKHLQRLQPASAAFLHIGSAISAGILWLGLTSTITWFLQPQILVRVIPAAAPGTMASGAAVYLLVAVVSSSIQSGRRASELDAALLRVELAQLRARVEPHFLFNTLETISALVKGRPEDAEDAIARLGRILRRVVDQKQEVDSDGRVSLAEELRLVRDYLAIARLRLGDRLRVFEQVAPDVVDLAIPPFILQTLVENAVQHGIGPCPDGGTVSISGVQEGEKLVLVISDDGVGADETTLCRTSRGLGLVRALLSAHFGNQATFDIAAGPGFGVSVRLSMPAEQIE